MLVEPGVLEQTDVPVYVGAVKVTRFKPEPTLWTSSDVWT